MKHLLISTVWNGDLLCLNCGGRQTALPNDLNDLVDRIGSFIVHHRPCRPHPAGAALKEKHDADVARAKEEAAT